VACYCMPGRYWISGGVLALSSLLVAGCGSVSARKAPAPKDENVTTLRRGEAEGRTLNRLVEAHAHYAAGVVHETSGDARAAAEEYYRAALLDPDDEGLVLEVSRHLLSDKQPERALEVVTRAAARPGASGQIFARLGAIYAQVGKPEQAVEANRTAIRKSPDSLVGYQNLSLGYLERKQTQEALKVLDEAARQPRPDAEFLIGLAELYRNFGLQVPAQRESANAKALALLNRAAKPGPTAPLLRLRLADDFNLLGEPAKAAQYYLDVLKHPPDLPLIEERVRASLATIYLRGSDHQRAVEHLEALLRDDPTNPEVYYYLGRIALEDKKPAAAVDAFRKTVLLRPDFEYAYYSLAMAQIAMDKPVEALATLDRARKRFPQNFNLEYYTGLAFSHQKAYGEALQHYLAAEVVAKATDPQQLGEVFYFQVGAASERKGDYAQAEKYFELCLRVAPDSAEAMNYLGYMWAEHGMKLEKARELIEKAVKAEPKNAAFLDSLAWVLFKLKQPKEALPHALKAVELSEKPDATVYDHLGDIYAALQQPEKACEAWRKSLSVEPDEEVRKKLEASDHK
jgi:tetratricopeptide (TPR) repeat protein